MLTLLEAEAKSLLEEAEYHEVGSQTREHIIEKVLDIQNCITNCKKVNNDLLKLDSDRVIRLTEMENRRRPSADTIIKCVSVLGFTGLMILAEKNGLLVPRPVNNVTRLF